MPPVLNWQISGFKMTKLVMAATALSVLLLALPARAHQVSHIDVIEEPGPEASGCYFSRGQMYCGRYCYVEINGKRYCQPRARDAYPQGEIYVEETLISPAQRYRRHHHRRLK
jgi:hypothetical protein